MSRLTCTRCGSSWDSTDSRSLQFFQTSETYSRNDYVSPSDIAALDPAEDITFCPKCHSRQLDRALTSGNPTDFLLNSDKRVDPDGLDRERSGS